MGRFVSPMKCLKMIELGNVQCSNPIHIREFNASVKTTCAPWCTKVTSTNNFRRKTPPRGESGRRPKRAWGWSSGEDEAWFCGALNESSSHLNPSQPVGLSRFLYDPPKTMLFFFLSIPCISHRCQKIGRSWVNHGKKLPNFLWVFDECIMFQHVVFAALGPCNVGLSKITLVPKIPKYGIPQKKKLMIRLGF